MTRIVLSAIVPFMLLASCSTETAPASTVGAAGFTSGTRLHAQVYAAGSTKLWHDWFDTQLKVTCSFRDTDDGGNHCIPTGPTTGSSYNLFGDAACTAPVVEASSGCGAPEYATVGAPGGACSRVHVAKVGAPFTGTTYALNNGACTASGANPTSKFFSVGATLPSSTLVSGSMKIEARGPALSVQVEHGDDGSSRVVNLYDTGLAGPCAPIFESEQARLTDYAGRCAPTSTAFQEGDFGDAVCGSPVAYAPAGACTTVPRNAIQVYGPISKTCPQEALLGYAQLGTPYLGDVYRSDQGTCQKQPSKPPSEGFANVGPTLPGSSMAKVAQLREGQERIVKDWLVDDAGHKLMVVGLYDTLRKEPCFWSPTNDGKMRCTPRAGNGGSFSDATCTKALFQASTPAAGCPVEPTPKVVVALATFGVCQTPGKLRFYTVGGPVSLTETYSLNNEKCTGPFPSGTATYYDTTEIPPETFAELSDVTE